MESESSRMTGEPRVALTDTPPLCFGLGSMW